MTDASEELALRPAGIFSLPLSRRQFADQTGYVHRQHHESDQKRRGEAEVRGPEPREYENNREPDNCAYRGNEEVRNPETETIPEDRPQIQRVEEAACRAACFRRVRYHGHIVDS